MGIPMEGFFEGVDVMFGTMAFVASAAPQGVSTEAPIPFTESVPMEGTHTEGVSEDTLISTETPIPQEGAIPPAAQTEVASPSTPLVISTSDPFAALSQAAKDGSSLVVTPSSIPSSATRGPDADLSSEGSEDILKDPDDEPIIKNMISKSDKEESADSEIEFMGMCLFLPFLLSFFPIFLLSLLYIYTCVTLLLQFPFT